MKRWIFKLVVILLLGAVVNVAVAWGFALRIAVTELEMDEAEAPYWYADGYAHAGRALRRSGTLVIDYSNIEATHQEFNEYLTRLRAYAAPEPMDQYSFPSGSLPFSIWQSGSHPSFKYGWEIANGWPLAALRYRMFLTEDDWNSEKPPVIHHGLELSTSEGPMTSSLTGRALPLHPIWPGFGVNTIFYATVLWLLALGPFTARRMIRRKRGQCIKCSYDLRGTSGGVCPECGHELCAGAKT